MSSQMVALGFVLVGLQLIVSLSAATITLDSKDEFNVTWTLDDENEPKFITFQLSAKRAGWIALGFSPNGGMAGSDIIKAAIDGEGNVELLDMYALEEAQPTLDKNSLSDVELLSGSRMNGIFHVTFKRPLTNCDPQDWDITEDTTRLIFAWGTSDTFQYHGANSRGSKSVYLLAEPKPAVPDTELDVMVHDFKYEAGYLVPEGEHTIYAYGLVRMPEVTEKNHIISFEPTITPGNEGYVHHMIVYACYHDFNSTKYLEERVVYIINSMPAELRECTNNAIMTWGVGGGRYHLPDHTGIAIGDELAPKAWLLSIHYDNPTMTAGTHKDYSGLSIRYTNRIRANDMGHLNVGSTTGIYVPPGQKEFYVRGDCSASCMQFFPGEITVFGYLLHAHLLGRSIHAYRHRDGKTDLVAQDQFYDNNFQETRHSKETFNLLPGDELSVACRMESTHVSNMTYGGLATTEEMCLLFLYYYPRMSEAPVRCRSQGVWTADGDWMSKLSQQHWSENTVKEFETQAMTASYTTSCSGMTGSNRLEGQVFNAYPVEVNCPEQCKPSSCTPRSWQALASAGTRVVFSVTVLCLMVFSFI